MKIELRPLAKIKPYENNPRLNDAAVDAVAESIRRFGFRQPVVVDTDGVIVVGHTRWKAARKLGLKKVPVHVATDLTAEQAILADIRKLRTGGWTYRAIATELTSRGVLTKKGNDKWTHQSVASILKRRVA